MNNLHIKKKGFTLVELVAVMAIIVVLAAAFVPKIGNYITEARKVTVLNEAKDIVTAYESVSYKSSIGAEDIIKGSDLQGTNKPIEAGTLEKLSNFTVEECRMLLDSENYSFDFDASGNVVGPTVIPTP